MCVYLVVHDSKVFHSIMRAKWEPIDICCSRKPIELQPLHVHCVCCKWQGVALSQHNNKSSGKGCPFM